MTAANTPCPATLRYVSAALYIGAKEYARGGTPDTALLTARDHLSAKADAIEASAIERAEGAEQPSLSLVCGHAPRKKGCRFCDEIAEPPAPAPAISGADQTRAFNEVVAACSPPSETSYRFEPVPPHMLLALRERLRDAMHGRIRGWQGDPPAKNYAAYGMQTAIEIVWSVLKPPTYIALAQDGTATDIGFDRRTPTPPADEAVREVVKRLRIDAAAWRNAPPAISYAGTAKLEDEAADLIDKLAARVGALEAADVQRVKDICRLTEQRDAAEAALAAERERARDNQTRYETAEDRVHNIAREAFTLSERLNSAEALAEQYRVVVEAAVTELEEAEDKFWVMHCNHPGGSKFEGLTAKQLDEDKAFMASHSKRMGEAARKARQVVSALPSEGGKRG